MSKSLELTAVAALLFASLGTAAHAGDAAAGKAIFQRCAICHRIGPGAKNAFGPVLNNVVGRKAGTYDHYNYSPAMKKKGENGLVWDEKTLGKFLTNPMKFVPGTKMRFMGLHDAKDRENVIAYLETFSEDGKSGSSGGAKGDHSSAEPASGKANDKSADASAPTVGKAASTSKTVRTVSHRIPAHGIYHLGRVALPAEIDAWNVDVRPDGTGLPDGHGTAAEGDRIFASNCAQCHGDFGEGVGRWPALAGGDGSLKKARPEKTVGSYWPYLSTVYDYIHRAMPFGNAHSLSNNDVYALTAYVLYLNYIVKDENFELSKTNFTSIHMPNENGFIQDTRTDEKEYAKNSPPPCMTDCKSEKVRITMEAKVLNVTPDSQKKTNGSGIE